MQCFFNIQFFMLTDYNFSSKVGAKLDELNPMEGVELCIDIVGEGKKFV